MVILGQWILFSLVFIILFFFVWYTARFICTTIFVVISLLVIAYLLNQMSLLPEPLHTYADNVFRKETCETIKAKIREWSGPCQDSQQVQPEKKNASSHP
jgi:hypothetical protein